MGKGQLAGVPAWLKKKIDTLSVELENTKNKLPSVDVFGEGLDGVVPDLNDFFGSTTDDALIRYGIWFSPNTLNAPMDLGIGTVMACGDYQFAFSDGDEGRIFCRTRNMAAAGKGWYEITQEDSGSEIANLEYQFEHYMNTTALMLTARKIGHDVEITGTVKTNQPIAANSETTVFTLSEKFRPSKYINHECPTDSADLASCRCRVHPDGRVAISRYGTTADSIIPSGTVISFNIRYFVGF